MLKKKSSLMYKGMKIELHADVYEPAEDTFLLLKHLLCRPKDHVLEIGTGCGIIALHCAQYGCQVVSSDINPFAIKLARKNFQKNKDLLQGSIELRKGNLFSVVHKNEVFNDIIFNPPYLPTTEHEKLKGWLDAAFNGGATGLTIIQKFLSQVKHYLAKKGQVYFLYSSLAKKSLFEQYLKQSGLYYTSIAHQHFESETIHVYLLAHESDTLKTKL